MGSYSMPPPGEETHARRQITVIVLLLFGMVALYQFEQFASHPFDPTAMLALGFVVLASYTIGGHSFTYNDLAELRKWRAELRREVRSSSSSGSRIRLADMGG